MLARIRKAMEEKDQGFTLIELLVVIIIIGILAAIAIPVFLNQRKKGWDAQAKSDLRNAATAEETYLTDNNSYTATLSNLISAGFKVTTGVTIGLTTVDSGTTAGTYTANSSGTGTAGYCEVAKSTSGNYFLYDSLAGGLVNQTFTTAPTTATAGVPTDGACAKGIATTLSAS